LGRHVVIIGNGVAGFAAARRLRHEDSDVTISIFSDEPHPFYLRSRLKDYIGGALAEHELILESRNLYRRERLNLFLQSPVLGIDTENREVMLSHGERVRYDRLLLAMGCAPERLDVPGADLRGVFSLRTLADAVAIRSWMLRKHRAVVIGEGIVSVQLAEALARMPVAVDYTLLGEHLCPDVLDPTASNIVRDLLVASGVEVHPRVRVAAIRGEAGAVTGVELETGEVIPCDMLAHGCSFRPRTDILSDTPITCREGVEVDDTLETNVPGVFAAGDVVSLDSSGGVDLGRRWRNSFRLGDTAALNMLGRGVSAGTVGASLKTIICGVNVAVIGSGHLAEVDPSVQVEARERGATYRRLVFREEMLVGAILIGDTSHASMLEAHVRAGTLRADMAGAETPTVMSSESRLIAPLESACPICTDAIYLPEGILIGSAFECTSCGAKLKLTYADGHLAILPSDG
jgi:NAD(P)H-nitrite reductase large subunit